MAKKRRKDQPEEEYEFIPPEFDEKSFLEKDIQATKVQLLAGLLAIIFGVIGFAAGTINIWLGLVVLIIGLVFLLKYSHRLVKVKEDDIDKKTKAGSAIMFFFLFLAIWILLLNPPFV